MLNITVGVNITFKFIFANVNYIRHLWYYAVIEVKLISCNIGLIVRNYPDCDSGPPCLVMDDYAAYVLIKIYLSNLNIYSYIGSEFGTSNYR